MGRLSAEVRQGVGQAQRAEAGGAVAGAEPSEQRLQGPDHLH